MALAIFAVSVVRVDAQDADPLTVTLPSGKVIHFQDDAQKARYEAALQKRVTSPVAAQPTEAKGAKPRSTEAATKSASSDEKPAHAKVNASAPAFTADYYTATPAGWVGKKVALSVAYFSSSDDGPDKASGLQKLTAQTYNTTPGLAGSQSFGGHITVLANREDAAKLLQQCGTRYQYQASGWLKTTLINGEFRPLDAKGSPGTSREFVVAVGE